ncbi:hypothetical protein RIF29_08607 [Crotalaria pallida]|uniref:AAA+ ATPase domain-containing protein n=1 Tax=Crotalaria pallida TaxID=3830 RepID=A0AAN9FR16_CROPI
MSLPEMHSSSTNGIVLCNVMFIGMLPLPKNNKHEALWDILKLIILAPIMLLTQLLVEIQMATTIAMAALSAVTNSCSYVCSCESNVEQAAFMQLNVTGKTKRQLTTSINVVLFYTNGSIMRTGQLQKCKLPIVRENHQVIIKSLNSNFSCLKTLLLATGVLAAGGAAAYMQSRFRVNKHDLLGHCNGHNNNKEVTKDEVVKGAAEPKNKEKKGALKSLQLLSAILLSEMGQLGARDLLALVGIVASKSARLPISSCFASTRTIVFSNMVYYKISHVDGRITNPEQRIASDVPKFCSELSEVVQDDLTAVTDGLLYTWRLCSYASPKYVFWILAYVLGAGTAIRNFSPSFGKLMSREQQLEGEYRQLHSRLRTHSESIAYYNFLLKYLGATVAVILIIEPFFSGHLKPDSSTLGRAEMLSNLRYHTSVIISLFQSLGTLSISARKLNRLSGYADRIYELVSVSRELSLVDENRSLQRKGSRNCISEANYIEFSGVKVVTPTGNVLVDDLTLRVEPGSNLLITGPNGSGKSLLFRVLGGLWPMISGHIVKPGIGSNLNKEIFYVPQRPCTAVGTLREQQRLGMARLFYHKPKFAILDECTSAVTTDLEERFCAKVRAMGTSCITISHRPALVAFHDVVLSLDGEGGWSVHYRREDTSTEMGVDTMKASETKRQSDAKAVQRAFAMNKGLDSAFSNSKAQSYIAEVISSSPSTNRSTPASVVPQIHGNTRASISSYQHIFDHFNVLELTPASYSSFMLVIDSGVGFRLANLQQVHLSDCTAGFPVPTVLDKQGAQLLAVAFLVVSRTWVSDRIASLNGTTVRLVLEQDKASFFRLIGLSVLQSAASSFIAPSIRHLTARLALGWRIRLTQHLLKYYLIRLTQHLLKYYLRNNAFYKARLFFHEPKFGILDECTNATSVDVEEHLYGLAKDMGITFVTSSQLQCTDVAMLSASRIQLLGH